MNQLFKNHLFFLLTNITVIKLELDDEAKGYRCSKFCLISLVVLPYDDFTSSHLLYICKLFKNKKDKKTVFAIYIQIHIIRSFKFFMQNLVYLEYSPSQNGCF